MGDIIENRPPLSRWHKDYGEAFKTFAAKQGGGQWRHCEEPSDEAIQEDVEFCRPWIASLRSQ